MLLTLQKLNFARLRAMSLNFAAGQKKKFEKISANSEYNFILFDTESNCGGKKAELVELEYAGNTGDSFSKFVLPKWRKCDHSINKHASRVNKFQIIAAFALVIDAFCIGMELYNCKHRMSTVFLLPDFLP